VSVSKADNLTAGLRLDQYLAELLSSRNSAREQIENGSVTVNGKVRLKSYRLKVDDLVEYSDQVSLDAAEVKAVADPQFKVVHEDHQILVVDKAAGVVVHPGHGNVQGTLVQALEGSVYGGDDPERPGVVHRLDRDTSGLLVLAKTEIAYRLLKEQIGDRSVQRQYLALVAGVIEVDNGKIDAAIGRDRHERTKMSLDSDRSRTAITHFSVKQRFKQHSLLTVKLETGRTHQIRVHLEAIKHPVVGDQRYGTTDSFGLKRQFLHAEVLAFTHPESNERVSFSSDLPEELSSVLQRLRGTSQL